MSLKLIKKDIGGKFTGREDLVKKIYGILDRGMPGVVLTGPRGSGRSTLLARMGAMLQAKGYKVAPVAGETSAELILNAIAGQAKAAGVADAEKTFASPMEFVQKLYWFAEHFFVKEKVLLLLDDFDRNLDSEGFIANANLKEMVEFFNTSLQYKSSAFIIASERPLEGLDNLEIPGFTHDEFLETLIHRGALDRLPKDDLERCFEAASGNPLVLELLDAIGRREFGSKEFALEDLFGVIPGFVEDPIASSIDALLTGLKPELLEIAKIFAVYGFPLPRHLVLAHGIENGSIQRSDLDSLEECSLIEFDNLRAVYHMHPAVAEAAMQGIGPEELARFHLRAADCLLEEVEKQTILTIDFQIEALLHLRAAGEWRRLTELTLRVERELVARGFPQLAFELLLQLDGIDTSVENRMTILQRLGFLHSLFGNRDEAVDHTSRALEMAEGKGDRRFEAILLQQLGAIHSREKEKEQARDYYERSLELARQLDEAPLRLFNLQQLGGIHFEEKQWSEALSNYEEALQEYNNRKDINGAAMCLAQLGRIHFEMGSLKEALTANLKTFAAYSRLGYPDARAARREVMKVREAMDLEEFNAILEQYRIPADVFDPAKEDQQKSIDFLRRTALEAAAAKGKSPAEKAHALAYIDQILDKAPEGNPELEGFKNFFHMLKAYVNDQDTSRFHQTVPAGLLAIFKEVAGV